MRLKKSHWWFRRVSFQTIEIDLTQDVQELLSSFKYNRRREVRLAEQEDFYIEAYCDGRQFYDMQKSVVGAIEEVTYYPLSLLSPASHRLFTSISHPEHGVIAFHGYLIDWQKKIALLHMNVSIYRELQEDKHRKLAGLANIYLIFRDMCMLKGNGINIYDFGGMGSSNIATFKKYFGGKHVTKYTYKSPLF